jgi:fatty acid desaturase
MDASASTREGEWSPADSVLVWRRWELPTWILILVVYGGWGLLILCHAALPIWLLLPAGAWLVAWHMSLQHEILHGHPTRWRWLNSALGFPPLSLWLPYERYRATHIRHHRNADLTDPERDPESFYLPPERWARRGWLGRQLAWCGNTLAGRLVLGPATGVAVFLIAELRSLARGDAKAWRIWLVHGIGVAALLYWIHVVCGLPIGLYLACAYAGTALGLVRSFAEHQAAERVAHRTAIVENAPVLGLLFLHNNLHVVHHDRPELPWFEIPRCYRAQRRTMIARNGGLVYDGYGEIFRRFLFRPHHAPPHPLPSSRLSAPTPLNRA